MENENELQLRQNENGEWVLAEPLPSVTIEFETEQECDSFKDFMVSGSLMAAYKNWQSNQ